MNITTYSNPKLGLTGNNRIWKYNGRVIPVKSWGEAMEWVRNNG